MLIYFFFIWNFCSLFRFWS